MKKVLIANRGEIAVRVAQTLQQMGMRVAAVYSNADAQAVHVRAADEAYHLEGDTAVETYLRGDKILALATDHGVDAIHPGYGFLSENAAFASACEEAGITFIGPSAESIRRLGDKLAAKRLAMESGVPVAPSAQVESGGDWAAAALRVGFPLLVKAAAGGGGKGMRLVERADDLAAAVESAAREAKSAFGDARVFLEKYLERPRHVEFQVFADGAGNAVHLYERECSIQRRHQKIVEETPSPALHERLRQQMGEAAARLVKAAGYRNAGTVEFMVDAAGRFYFLEMNTRLQVEHPITEMTLGVDLVRAQVLVANGQPLPFRQEELRPHGHAMECRVYAEDAWRGFLPSSGTVARLVVPRGPGIRVDCGVEEGSAVTVHHDPMLAKLCVWAETRDLSIPRMRWALSRFVVLGLETNLEFLQTLMDHPAFRSGHLHTGFLAEHPLQRDAEVPLEALAAAQLLGSSPTTGLVNHHQASVWELAGSWRAV